MSSRPCHPIASAVYPRGCGGTYSSSKSWYHQGLSPRVRGNRLSAHRILRVYPRGCGGTVLPLSKDHVRRGSIPAGAGEPSLCFVPTIGLSPRVRGNHSAVMGAIPGSIPAGAGEPSREPCLPGSIPAGAGEPVARPHRGQSGLSPRVRGNLYRHRR